MFFQERISERIVEQIVDLPGEAFKNFRRGQSSSSSSHVPARVHEDADEIFKNFEGHPALESEGARQCQLIHAGCSARGCARVGLWSHPVSLREFGGLAIPLS